MCWKQQYVTSELTGGTMFIGNYYLVLSQATLTSLLFLCGSEFMFSRILNSQLELLLDI